VLALLGRTPVRSVCAQQKRVTLDRLPDAHACKRVHHWQT